MSIPAPRSGTIEGIQILRAVAALMVVFHHARHSIPGAEGWPAVGEAGVDIFFVISGFVMAHTTRRLASGSGIAERFEAARDFAFKRCVRVVPLYWLVLLWTSRRELAKGTAGADLAKDFLFFPHPNAAYPGRLWPTVVQGWTLNYEMFFYALFAAALLVGSRRLWVVCGLLAGLVAAGGVAAWFGLPHAGAGDWRSAALGFYTDDILLEFGFGVLLQRVVSGGLWSPLPPTRSAVLLVVGFALLLLGHGSHLPRSLCQGLPALLIVWAGIGAFRGARLPTWEQLGAASYAIYLLHWASFGAVKPVANWLGAAGTSPPGQALLLGSLFAVAIVSGLALHHLVERPFLRWAQDRLPTGSAHPA